MAGDGIEPSTSRFSVARSYQLSYPATVLMLVVYESFGEILVKLEPLRAGQSL